MTPPPTPQPPKPYQWAACCPRHASTDPRRIVAREVAR